VMQIEQQFSGLVSPARADLHHTISKLATSPLSLSPNMNPITVKIVDPPHKPYKTCKEYEEKIQSMMEERVRTAMQYLREVVSDKQSRNYRSWELYLIDNPVNGLGTTQFTTLMLQHMEQSEFREAVNGLWSEFVRQAIEKSNQGDN